MASKLNNSRTETTSDEHEEGVTRKRWSVHLPRFLHKQDLEEKRRALVTKTGNYKMYVTGLGEHKSKFLADIYVTFLDLAWPYVMLILFNIYLVIFMVFAIFWWLTAFNNGDFDNLGNPEHNFCLVGVTSFPTAILFSLETQTTIGYGTAYPNSHCAATVVLMYIQVVMGLFLETAMLGSVFVKIARPKFRAKTILFSKHAVVNQENGSLVLQVRVGDLRRSHLVDSSFVGMVIRSFCSKEGSYYPLYQFNCDFTASGMQDRVYLIWPLILTHVIDKTSPLYDVSPQDLHTHKFEIVVYLTGTVESTGEMCQARSSYLPQEILWGYRFESIEEFDTRHRQWHVNFKRFDNVVACQNAAQSARRLSKSVSPLQPLLPLPYKPSFGSAQENSQDQSDTKV